MWKRVKLLRCEQPAQSLSGCEMSETDLPGIQMLVISFCTREKTILKLREVVEGFSLAW